MKNEIIAGIIGLGLGAGGAFAYQHQSAAEVTTETFQVKKPCIDTVYDKGLPTEVKFKHCSLGGRDNSYTNIESSSFDFSAGTYQKGRWFGSITARNFGDYARAFRAQRGLNFSTNDISQLFKTDEGSVYVTLEDINGDEKPDYLQFAIYNSRTDKTEYISVGDINKDGVLDTIGGQIVIGVDSYNTIEEGTGLATLGKLAEKVGLK